MGNNRVEMGEVGYGSGTDGFLRLIGDIPVHSPGTVILPFVGAIWRLPWYGFWDYPQKGIELLVDFGGGSLGADAHDGGYVMRD
jgi:hypothetical protein